MLVRKRKQHVTRQKECSEGSAAEDTVQSLRSWIRKIEQSTTSVSSRLSAVEKRLSARMMTSESASDMSLQGPIESLVLSSKKKNAGDIGRALDRELTLLHNELVEKNEDLGCLKEKHMELEQIHMTMVEELQSLDNKVKSIQDQTDQYLKRSSRHEPFVMRLGTLEIPVEFSGVIGGLLAFVIAVLVIIDQKEILLSPLFLFFVGVLFIGFALLKMFRLRSHNMLRPLSSLPLSSSSESLDAVACQNKKDKNNSS